MRKNHFAVLLSAALLIPAGSAFADITIGELADFYTQNPDVKQKQEAFERKVERQKQEPAQDSDAPPPLDEDIQAEIAALEAASPDSYMSDVKREAEEEKAQVLEANIWGAAEALATPDTRALYREYLKRVVFFGKAKDGDAGRHIAWIKERLMKPRGWVGSFPTLKIGPLPQGIAGLWAGGAITLISHDIVVLSHEWFHHTDNANGMDGESKAGRGPKPEEIHAYDQMGKEI